MRPVIGITTYITTARFGFTGGEWELESALVPAAYVRAVQGAGGRPFLIPPAEEAVDETLDALDGLLFSGGSDLDPETYGQDPHPETKGVVPERDRAELALLEDRHEHAAELLGASEELFRELGVGIEQSEARAQERMRTSLYATLGDERADELRARGVALSVNKLVDAWPALSR